MAKFYPYLWLVSSLLCVYVLLGPMVVLFLIFCETSILSSTVVTPFYIPQSSVQEFLFSTSSPTFVSVLLMTAILTGFNILWHWNVSLGLEWKLTFSSPVATAEFECSNYHTIALISHTSKVMLKILQARLQQYVNWELPDVQAAFRKGRGTRDQIANICWIREKAREFQKNIYFCFTH